MRKKKVITKVMAMLLSFAVVFSMIPGAVFADEGGGNSSVTIEFSAQKDGSFLFNRQQVNVTDGLAEEYGYTVASEDHNKEAVEEPTVFDAMVAVHKAKYGDRFTKETAKNYLDIAKSGMLSKAFGEAASSTSFFVNGGMLNDGIVGTYGTTGYMADTARLKADDNVEFWFYQYSYWGDYYTYFTERDKSVFEGESFDLNLKGFMAMSAMGYEPKPKAIAGSEDVITVHTVNKDGSLSAALTDGKGNNIYPDSDGKISLAFEDAGEYVITCTGFTEDESPIVLPYCRVTVKEYNVNITVPEDAQLYVAEKPNNKHYVAFSKFESSLEKNNGDGTRTVSYNLTANKKYNYRVWGDGYVTYANIFTSPKANAASAQIKVTEDMLKPAGKTNKTVDRELTSNSKYNVADIYLNINEKGHLKINRDETYQLVNLRNWEAIDTVINNYFIEPDYNYTVIDENGASSDVVEIDENGLLTAKKDGTAIVLVTYDSINAACAAGGPFFGAIWPENTGVFAVTVGGTDSGITTGMKINEGKNAADTSAGKLAGDNLDAEHDVIYFLTAMTDAEGNTEQTENACGEYTFTPEGAETVEIANPVVSEKVSFNGFRTASKNKDGSYTVKLTEGRNIVKLSNAKGSEYQVITAKGVTATVSNVTSPGKTLTAGDAFSVKFSTVYHPANKLAGVYNMSAGILYGNVEGYDEGVTFGGSSNQYNFASTEKAQTVSNQVKWEQKGFFFGATLGDKLTVPASYDKAQLTMSDGCLIAAGYGDPYGNHRGITLTDGKAPNLNASIKVGYMGKLPDITVEIKKDAAADVKNIEVTKQPKKTSYYEGDVFDASGMEIEVTYEDNSKRTVAGGFEYDKTPLGKDTDKVTVSFGGKTVEIAISVQELVLEQISIDTPPTKTEYVEGEYFNPSGMIVKAGYNSGKTVEITDYTYSKEELKKGDTEVVITYGDKTASQAITVSERTVIPSENITVKFSLMGDTKHGDNGQAHTLKAGNLTTWVKQISVEADKNATVLDIVEKVLAMNGMGFKNASGNYISEINGLGEFDNGPNSGWMYTLNGVVSLLGVAEQTLKNGDVIVMYYTDDYTKESGSEQWNTPAQEIKEVTTSGADTKTTTAPAEVKVSGNTATATVTDENAKELVKQAKENKSAEIIINVSAADTKDAETVNLELDKKTVESIVKDTEATVTVKTPAGEINLDKETLKQIAGEAEGDTIVIEITKVLKPEESQKTLIGTNGNMYRLTVKSGNKVISDFNGTVTVRLAVPAALKDKNIAAIHIEGSALEKLEGKRITQNKEEFYEFTTKHFSEFALVDTAEVKLDSDDKNDSADKAKSLIKELKLKAVSSKTAKKNVKVTTHMSSKSNSVIKELSDMGFTVKYRYYRSVKKASKYTAVKTKNTKTYINTKGKRGSKYYYKVRAVVYDGDKVIAQSALKQCKYAVRTWSK